MEEVEKYIGINRRSGKIACIDREEIRMAIVVPPCLEQSVLLARRPFMRNDEVQLRPYGISSKVCPTCRTYSEAVGRCHLERVHKNSANALAPVLTGHTKVHNDDRSTRKTVEHVTEQNASFVVRAE